MTAASAPHLPEERKAVASLITGAARRLAAEHWLLSAAPDRKLARAAWEERRYALLPCGVLFAAVRIPSDVVQAAAGSDDQEDVDRFLAEALISPTPHLGHCPTSSLRRSPSRRTSLPGPYRAAWRTW